MFYNYAKLNATTNGKLYWEKSNTPQQAMGHGLACSFRPKGRDIQPSRHSPNIRASAAAWIVARGNKIFLGTDDDWQKIQYLR